MALTGSGSRHSWCWSRGSRTATRSGTTMFRRWALPGAGTWNEARDARHLEGIARVYVVVEPDRGGEAVKHWLARSAIRERAYLVDLAPFKDPSAMHCADPDAFKARFAAALERRHPLRPHPRRGQGEEQRRSVGGLPGARHAAADPGGICARLPRRGSGRRGAHRHDYLPRPYLPLPVPAGFSGGQGAELRRQEFHGGKRAALLPARGRALHDGGQRPGARLHRGRSRAPLPRGLRGGGDARRIRELPHPLAALRGAPRLRGGGEDPERLSAAPDREAGPDRTPRHHNRSPAASGERDPPALAPGDRHPGADAGDPAGHRRKQGRHFDPGPWLALQHWLATPSTGSSSPTPRRSPSRYRRWRCACDAISASCSH